MRNIINLISLFLLIGNYGVAQQKELVLINKIKHDSVFIKEHSKVKLFTKEGKKVAGKFLIIDENLILIKTDTINLKDIKKIKKASSVSTIVLPIAFIVGLTFTSLGVYGFFLATNEFTADAEILRSLLIPGLPMLIGPFFNNEHQYTKWEFKVISKQNKKL